jgi:ketosteroid isomerase-like protein
MAEHPNVEATRTAFEAFMKGDTEALAPHIADDAVWHIPGSHRFAGTFEGKAAIMGRSQEQAEAGVQTSFDEIHDIVGGDDHVVALMRTSVTGPGGSAAGNAIFVLHVKDGTATEFWAYNEHQAEIDRLLG